MDIDKAAKELQTRLSEKLGSGELVFERHDYKTLEGETACTWIFWWTVVVDDRGYRHKQLVPHFNDEIEEMAEDLANHFWDCARIFGRVIQK